MLKRACATLGACSAEWREEEEEVMRAISPM
jgi:hypothetical protein